MRMFLIIVLFLLSSSYIFVPTVYAQLQIPSTTPVITLEPAYPQAGQHVVATVTAGNALARASTVTWLINGVTKQQRNSGTTFTFKVGALGSSEKIGVLLQSATKGPLAQEITIRPTNVTLLWEGNTYTPPFYQGRALYSAGSTIRAEAAVDFVTTTGVHINPRTLLYTWKRNGTILQKYSGIGASSLIIKGPAFLGSDILEVTVATTDNQYIGQSAVKIDTSDPVIQLYEKNPLTGIQYNQIIEKDHSLFSVNQIEIQAVPYFMGITNPADTNLTYSWSVNNTPVSNRSTNASLLTLKMPKQKQLQLQISVAVKSARNLLQIGLGNATLTFKNTVRNSFFGF